LLQKQPGYLEARNRKREQPIPNGGQTQSQAVQTPEELMEDAFQDLRESLGREILAKLKNASTSRRKSGNKRLAGRRSKSSRAPGRACALERAFSSPPPIFPRARRLRRVID
jgi:hypothetical protein